MSDCTCDGTKTGSRLKREKIQSMYPMSSKVIDAAASPAYSPFMDVPNASDVLYQLINAGAAGAIVNSFYLESIGEYDALGNKLAIDASGDLALANTIDPDTGIGTPLTDAEIEALEPCLIKQRIGNCGKVPTVEVDEAHQLEGDTGAIGNVYNLEMQIAEIGTTADKCGCKKPCFVRICIEAAAPTVFVLNQIECGQHQSQGIVNCEVVK